MVKTNYKLRGNEKVYILPIGDIHIGSEQFDEKYFQYCLDTVDSIKSDKRIYLMGDLVEAASKQVGNSSFKTDMSLDDQIDYVIKSFKPYRKDIVNMVQGNHCARLSKDFDLNVMRIISRALKVPDGNQFLDTFYINQEPYTIYTRHGKGSAAYAHTAQGKMIREHQHIDADMYLNGHSHRLDYFTTPNVSDGKIKRRHYVMTGSFLKYNGYADSMGLPVLPESFIQLNINKDLRVKSTNFYIDQVRPDLMEALMK